ncbi:inovirus Gp2 family protein [Vogesella sp. GCM10023246]|uniref:Inovirus Gp2 family protein n=1 Tax=Vogesella oryzagri TaxID=3160864 RepID=A0ABV1M9J9_9NEIS
MKRHPLNSSLHLHEGQTYNGRPIMKDKGPFVKEYLNSLHGVTDATVSENPRAFGLRFDLHFPDVSDLDSKIYTSKAITRFIESLKAKIAHNRQQAKSQRATAHDTVVRYVWASEQNDSVNPHWHVAILLNRDAYRSLGRFELGRDNMYNRLVSAWASALKMTEREAAGLVHIPDNPVYELHRDDQASIDAFFLRASYLCKADTKQYGNGRHGFGCSRR